MDKAGIRRLVTPELVVLCVAVLVAFGLMLRAGSAECHHWKQELNHITGAFLASAGEEEYPESGGARRATHESESLRRATNRVLDSRPFGCF